MEDVFRYIHDPNEPAIFWTSHESLDVICIDRLLFTALCGKREQSWRQHFSRDIQCSNMTAQCRMDKMQFICFSHPELNRYSGIGVYQSIKKNVKNEEYTKSKKNKKRKIKKEIMECFDESFFENLKTADSGLKLDQEHYLAPGEELIEFGTVLQTPRIQYNS